MPTPDEIRAELERRAQNDPALRRKMLVEAMKARQAQASPYDVVGTRAWEAGQGATFGFSDEAYAAMQGAGDVIYNLDVSRFGDTYDQELEQARAYQDAFRQTNPWEALGWNLAGSVASGIGAAGAAKAGLNAASAGVAGLSGATKAGIASRSPTFAAMEKLDELNRAITTGTASLRTRAGVGAASGAVYGGLYGFGNAEGGVAQRLEGAGIGAAAGGVLGGILPPALAAASSVGRGVKNITGMDIRFGPKPGAQPGTAVAVRPAGAVAGGADDAIEGAAEEVAQVPARRTIGGRVRDAIASITPRFATPEEKAADYLAYNVGRSVPKPGGEVIDDLADEALGTPKPRVLADSEIAPELREVAADAATQPGVGRTIGKTFTGQRQEGQVARIEDDLANIVSPSKDFGGTIEALIADRAAKAKPLYDEALKVVIRPTERLAGLLGRPSMKDAMRRGARIAADEGADVTDGMNQGQVLKALMSDDPNEVQAGLNALAGQGGLNMKVLHYAKQALDDMIEAERDSITGRLSEKGRALQILKNELLQEIDAANPAYAEARKVFAGRSEMISAMREGKDFWRKSPEDIARDLEGMTPEQREFYQAGAVQTLIDEIQKVPTEAGNAFKRIFGNTAKRRRLEALLGPEKFKQLEEALQTEDAMYKTFAAIFGNSKTKERLAQQADLEGFSGLDPVELASAGVAAANGSLWPGAAMFLRQAWNRTKGFNEATRAKIADMLFSDDPQKIQEALNLINNSLRRWRTSNAGSTRRAAGAQSAGAASGSETVRNRPGPPRPKPSGNPTRKQIEDELRRRGKLPPPQ